MPSTSLEKRLAALEQRRERAGVMHVLFGGPFADKHVGAFRVKAGGGRTRYEIRTQGEAWETFQKRMDQYATGALRLVQFQPTDDAGNDLYLNETQEHTT